MNIIHSCLKQIHKCSAGETFLFMNAKSASLKSGLLAKDGIN